MKTYISRTASLRILVRIKDKKIPIEFHWDVVSAGGSHGCSFSTEDKSLQNAIEKHELYGSVVLCKEVEQTLSDTPSLKDGMSFSKK